MKPAVTMTDAEAAAMTGRAAAVRSSWARPVTRSRTLPLPVFLAADAAAMLGVHESTIARLAEREPALASCRCHRGRPVFTPADFHQLARLIRRRT